MDNHQSEHTPYEELPPSKKEETRRTYHKPFLKELGDLRNLTLGGSPGGPGDSGPDNYYPPY